VKNLKGPLLLLLATIIWGLAFVAQSVGMDYLGPFSFNTIRFIIGAFTLIPFINYKELKSSSKPEKKILLISSLLSGLALAFASNFQQFGMQYTTVGKAGFITSFYIIFVPFINFVLGKKPSKNVYIALIIAIFGFYLLCINEQFTVGKGDFYILLSALFFAIQIVLVSYFCQGKNLIAFSFLQFVFCALFGSTLMFTLESPTWIAIKAAWIPLLYAGVFSCGIAYTLQILGQRYVEPNTASLILSLESVFSTIFGFIILHQILTTKETLGCILVFISVIIVQVKISRRKKLNEVKRII